ncbi:MAG TPA: hypothetical protein EYH31_01805, partial [Anaerolineae bacterium]|nr:hypothetical protein [Anaerolineae bacterium]
MRMRGLVLILVAVMALSAQSSVGMARSPQAEGAVQHRTIVPVFLFSLGAQAPVGQFNEPRGIAIGSDGRIYVADTFNNRIQQFTTDGVFIRTWGSQGTGEG